MLISRRGGSGDNFTDTVLDDAAATPIIGTATATVESVNPSGTSMIVVVPPGATGMVSVTVQNGTAPAVAAVGMYEYGAVDAAPMPAPTVAAPMGPPPMGAPGGRVTAPTVVGPTPRPAPPVR